MKSLAHEAYEQILTAMQQDGALTGVPSGYGKLDDMLGGLQRSDLVILAARPSMGKTALALSIARNSAGLGLPVAVFSVEMAAAQLMLRLVSAEAHINAQNLRTGRVQDADMDSIRKAVDTLAELPVFIDDSPALSVMELRAKCRRLKSEHNIGLVVVDYLQLLHAPKPESREREISTISRTLKQIAKELNVPVLALSQLNRMVENRADKRPMLSDLRESGSIEQDADVVLFVHRPEHYEIATFDDGTPTAGMAEVIIGKQRNGPVGSTLLEFEKEFARFENPGHREEQKRLRQLEAAANERFRDVDFDPEYG